MVHLQRALCCAGLNQIPPGGSLSPHRYRWLLVILAVEGLLAVSLTLATQSEATSAFWLGYSKLRLALAGVGLLGALLCGAAALLGWARPAQFQEIFQSARQWLAEKDRLMGVTLSLGATTLLAAWSFLFTWLFVPAPLRWMLAWAGLAAGQALATLRIDLPELYREKRIASRNL